MCRGHSHQGRTFGATPRLAKDSDASRVATELLDVVLHPIECEHEVEHANVAGVGVHRVCGDSSQIEEAKCVEPVVDGHDDNVATLRKARAVIEY